MKAPKMCFDKVLPRNVMQVHRVLPTIEGERTRAVALAGKQWPNGSVITIRFMDGASEQQDLVRKYAPEWTKYANLSFEFTDDPTAHIRVSFDSADGAWSYVGTDNLNIPLHAATLNLGWVDEGVILHEFGHMIGLSHEHQNPVGGIEWNEQFVIDLLAGPPNYWTEEQARHNVLNKYSMDQIHGTEFDPESVMLYAFPAEWTLNGISTQENEKLSALDKDFVKAAEMYPPDSESSVTDLLVAAARSASITNPGEVDEYRIAIDESGKHLITTLGDTDLYMSLYGPNSKTTLVAENDDGGIGRNAQLYTELVAGEYVLQVRHYSESGTGTYNVLVARVD